MNTWKGKPLEGMSREALIEALTELGEAYQRQLSQHMHITDNEILQYLIK